MENLTLIEHSDARIVGAWLEGYLRESLASRDGALAVAVPGGSTPFPIMELLAGVDLDWARLTIWPGDDRVVAEDHPASNTGKIRAIFEPLGARIADLSGASQPPRFVLAWLGMGGDGHIASLFPNTNPRVDEPEPAKRLTPDPLPPEAPFDRVTLTMPSLLASDHILFTLGGSGEKREVFDAAVRGDHDLPIARFLGAAKQPVTCFA